MLGTYFSVHSAARYSEAAAFARTNHYDLVVFCHTLTIDQQGFLALTARATYPRAQVLVLSSEIGRDLPPFAHQMLAARTGPWALVQHCARMVGLKLKSKAQHLTAAD